jgi:hypothetical protein
MKTYANERSAISLPNASTDAFAFASRAMSFIHKQYICDVYRMVSISGIHLHVLDDTLAKAAIRTVENTLGHSVGDMLSLPMTREVFNKLHAKPIYMAESPARQRIVWCLVRIDGKRMCVFIDPSSRRVMCCVVWCAREWFEYGGTICTGYIHEDLFLIEDVLVLQGDDVRYGCDFDVRRTLISLLIIDLIATSTCSQPNIHVSILQFQPKYCLSSSDVRFELEAYSDPIIAQGNAKYAIEKLLYT